MKIYFAPMEGLTDSVYRRLHHQYFGGVDRYYMPFLSPTVHRSLTPREARELPPADSQPFTAIPQLLTKVADDFLWAAEQCRDLGYEEVNLNVGCPSGTVTAKGKGSGMLRDPEALDSFLEAIFEKSPLPISVKTRLGFENAEEFPRLLEVYNRYPICELTIHPRVRAQFYKGSVDIEAFRYAAENSRAHLCYNGNLCSVEDIEAFQKDFPAVEAVMLGRGLIGDPGMLLPGGTQVAVLEQFMDALLEEYAVVFGSRRNAMFRLKENWHLLCCRFEDSEKLTKKLRKTTDYDDFRAITKELLHTCPLSPRLNPDW